MKKQYAFYFNSEACSGCKACQIACKDKHDLAEGIMWRRVYEVAGGDWIKQGHSWKNEIFAYNLSISCNHCIDPACLHACPTKAILKRKDGIVYINAEKCMGCKYCEWVCPYGAPQFNKESGLMEKCDFCMDYIDEGKQPSCVTACPMRVLDFGEYDKLTEKYEQADVFPLPESGLTQPAIIIAKHRDADKANHHNAEIINKEEVNYAG